ncbi:MAG: DNA-protecting protein DprA [Actinobacteria bacterium]|nr:MAG: DNA-protecting protein DprA [Actinomycetota bacterium]
MEEAYRAALACIKGMNSLALPRLLHMTDGARELWEIFKSGGARACALVGAEKAAAYADDCRSTEPEAVLENLKRKGIRIITPQDRCFSDRLRAIYDPPALLFIVGNEPPEDVPYVAVVGARKASSYGRWAAGCIGGELARRGVVVVSGAAYGIDGHAHRGCLEGGGFTMAVLGCGIDNVYPYEHAGLLRSIASSGCIISEYPPGEAPLPWRFPHRNRIIAGLSHAVVVVEATEKSGALITADIALEEGREVMAVPGPIGSALSRGTNRLIQKGAKLVMEVEDICEELNFACVSSSLTASGSSCRPGAVSGMAMSPLERRCVEILQGIPRSLDWIAAREKVPVPELLACLTSMSFKGWIAEEAGGRYRLLVDPCSD